MVFFSLTFQTSFAMTKIILNKRKKEKGGKKKGLPRK